jgi:hypothetical protein
VQGHGSVQPVGKGNLRGGRFRNGGGGQSSAEGNSLDCQPWALGVQVHNGGIAGQRIQCRRVGHAGQMCQFPCPGDGNLAVRRELVA